MRRQLSSLVKALEQRTGARWEVLAPSTKLAILATPIGFLAGLACIVLEGLTQAIAKLTLTGVAGFVDGGASAEHRFFARPENLDWHLSFSPFGLLTVISLGGCLSGWLVSRFSPEAAGAGTDASVDAFHNRKGRIEAGVIWVKAVASAVTLGTGGSAGREGPIVQISAAIGSSVSDALKLSTRDRRTLLAAGMGAGVGAMFRAPLAGALFAGEIFYRDGDIEAEVLVPSSVASIVAYSVYSQAIPIEQRYQPIFGDQLAYGFESPMELPWYLILGFLMYGLSAAYTWIFHASSKVFAALPVPVWLRPGIGGALAGLVGIGAFYACGSQQEVLSVLGTGYGALQKALTGDATLTIQLLVAVAVLKMITSALSVGSGGSGGVFGPSMVIGGCAGGAFGILAHQLAPGVTSQPATFAVVGAAGLFAGVARAPISTIVMVRELTGDFGLLVPTMLVCAFTFLVSSRWQLYRSQVPSRLQSPAHRGDLLVDVLEGLVVRDVFRRDLNVMLIHQRETLDQIVHHLAEGQQHYFPVLDDDGLMVGIFSDEDVRPYLYDETLWQLVNASDVMTSPFESVSPDDDMNIAMQKFTSLNVDELPVIEKTQPGVLLGFFNRKELIAAYNRRVLEHRKALD